VVTAIANKDAEMVANAIYKEWSSKFGILAQIHTNRGKEFVNKLWAELFQLLNISHTKMSPAHSLCNAQVEVFNKRVKKFLQSFVDDTMLNWDTFLPALVISYNTSYHSTIASTQFELLFGEKARLPSFPRNFTMAKLLQLNVSVCYKNSEKKCMNLPVNTVRSQSNILI
jgi:hypothetical protein